MSGSTRTAQATGALQSGSKGPQVQAWQRFLAGKGIACTADGAYGPETAKATASFQQANALVADGVAGPSTLAVAQVVHGYQAASGQANTTGQGKAAGPQATQGKLNPTFPLPK